MSMVKNRPFVIRKLKRGLSIGLSALLLVGCAGGGNKNTSSDNNKFADHVRTTDFQTPEEEMAGFTVPEGFEISLFASEPDITKPINMEFDDQGRLWVTQSSEYPIAAGQGAGRDRITILEDRDGDGRAEVFTNFNDSLNIPIGIMPVADGAVAYSIPNVYRFKDNNGDGKSDSKEVLLGEFGFKDTHGMVNNFVRGFDGWIHACHGFTNISKIAGKDGDSIAMESGNTFRFRPDGSRVEKTTNGRINPFGSAYDERGYLYSVDCHSKPIFQLISGGDYPQWGKKDPAIGYAPEMMSYELGSTALAGLVYYTDQQFPEEYQKSFFTGDVVTCRIDRNTVTYQGATPIAKKETPFLTSEDPWFRPVDVKTGPDGSMYVADFYNKIIGHYEVSLDHPGRDRLSGRIWKITYTGKDRKKAVPVTNWAKASLKDLVKGLDHPHQSIRMKVADRLVEVQKEKAIQPVLERVKDASSSITGYIHGLWVLHRLGALTDQLLKEALNHSNPLAKQHALRILAEGKGLTKEQEGTVLNALGDKDPFIQRTAAEVLNKFPNVSHVDPLLNLYERTPVGDSHLKYTALLAMRNNLRGKGVVGQIVKKSWTGEKLAVLATAMQDVPSPAAASFVLNYILSHEIPTDKLRKSLEYVGRYGTASELDKSITLITGKFSDNQETQLSLYQNLKAGIAQSGTPVTAKMRSWGIQLAGKFLNDQGKDIWMSKPQEDRTEDFSPWKMEDAFLTDVVPAFRIYFSEKNGYKPRATLYTTPFKLPAELAMNIFDNDVDRTDEKIGLSKNAVRIRLANGGKLIGEYRVNQKNKSEFKDLIKTTSFDLKKYAGQMGYIEVVDSSENGAIGIGKLNPAVIEMPRYTPSDKDEYRLQASEIAGDYKSENLKPALRKVVQSTWINPNTRLAAAGALTNMPSASDAALLGAIFINKSESTLLREKLAVYLGQLQSKEALQYLKDGLAGSTRPIQLAAATVLSGSSLGIENLLHAVNAKQLPADLLAEFKIKEGLSKNANASQLSQIKKLLASGENERTARKKLIEDRIAKFENTGKRKEKGGALFKANCAICHQVSGTGGMIGPQLDGIGNWGPRALTEKILDPNRNISESFRTYNIVMKNGKQETGLYRRTEGEVIVFADNSGKEFKISKKDMKSYTPSQYTLMPDQFRHVLSEEEFSSLMEYLLSIK